MFKRRYAILITLTACFLLLRLAILISSIDKLYLDEELFNGNITKELISGKILPFFDYQRSEYEGGRLLVGLAAVPFFLLSGDNLLSLKLAALSFPVLAFILWFIFLDKFFNKKVALLTSLLWIFSPPFFTKWSLLNFGSYSEVNFFTILAIFIFYEIFFVKEKRWLFVILGFVCGFAVFFHYYFIMPLLVILLFWFIFEKNLIFSKSFLIFALFFLLGFTPWIYYNLSHHFEGLIVSDKPMLYWFTHNSLWDVLARLKNFVVRQFPDSFGFQDIGFISRSFFSNTYYLVFIFSFFGLLFINRRQLLRVWSVTISQRRFAAPPNQIPPEIPLIVFFIVYLVIFAVSGFQLWTNSYTNIVTRYRYIIPFHPFMFALIAIFYHKMAGIRRPIFISRIGHYPAIIPISLCLIANLNLVQPDNFGRNYLCTIYKGYNYYDLGKIICWRYSDAGKYIALAKRIRADDDRLLCYAGMGWGFAKEKFSGDYGFYIRHLLPVLDERYWPQACERVGTVIGYDDKLVKELNDNVDARYHSYFYRGFGANAAKKALYDLKEYTRLFQIIDVRFLPYFHEGMGAELAESLFTDADGFIRIMGAIDEKFKPHIYKGLAEGKIYYQFSYDKFGSGVGRIGYDIRAWDELINKIGDDYKPYCYQRLGIEIGWRFIHGIKKYRLFFSQADTRYLPFLYRGVGIGIGWRFGYDIPGCIQLIKATERKYWPFIYEGLGAGVFKHYGLLPAIPGQLAGTISLDYQRYFFYGFNEARENNSHTR